MTAVNLSTQESTYDDDYDYDYDYSDSSESNDYNREDYLSEHISNTKSDNGIYMFQYSDFYYTNGDNEAILELFNNRKSQSVYDTMYDALDVMTNGLTFDQSLKEQIVAEAISMDDSKNDNELSVQDVIDNTIKILERYDTDFTGY